ncbi:hypothetical protein RJ639_013014 [Escallonia herrerae]|uniref:TBCC domain-containing protein 1 n=1 Tax=Escallonia herrerae TaxID=1293975 RepID=A0AA88VLF7_9ASTE|nr:hypothetical protein RJ639_013014 [Escallonia herrerae]
MTEVEPPPPPSTLSPPPATAPATATSYIHPRREPFEHGLIPIPKLIFTDGTQTLAPLKDKLLHRSGQTRRVNSSDIADTFQISPDHARLVLDTVASVLHSDSDPLVTAKPSEIDSVGVDVSDLILFLYVQSYKRLLPRGHKDSAAVADVWPSTSAFDGFLSALSPLQLVRSNSRRFMPSQADEEAHQLSYLQKHLGNILSLLADSMEGESEGDESLTLKLFTYEKGLITESTSLDVHLSVKHNEAWKATVVLTMEKFEHLAFFIYFGEKGLERIPMSQNAPFFANSDPDMPAVAVPAAQVHHWLLENISSALEHISERASSKENGPTGASDQDVSMTDVGATSVKASTGARGPSFIEGISKSSYVKQASDLQGSYIKVVNCHESVIYILAPLRYATVYGCSDATIVLGAIGKDLDYILGVRVEHCERVHVIVAAKRICIANCRECVFFLGVNQQPLIVGDNHKLQVAPYNTFYSQLEEHMNQVGIEATINRWNEPVALGLVDPHDSLSHPAGISDVQAESATRLDPDQFTNFLIPNWFGGESSGSTKDNPFPLPDVYMASQQRNHKNLGELKQILRETQLEDSRKRELSSALHVYFKEWLYGNGLESFLVLYLPVWSKAKPDKQPGNSGS